MTRQTTGPACVTDSAFVKSLAMFLHCITPQSPPLLTHFSHSNSSAPLVVITKMCACTLLDRYHLAIVSIHVMRARTPSVLRLLDHGSHRSFSALRATSLIQELTPSLKESGAYFPWHWRTIFSFLKIPAKYPFFCPAFYPVFCRVFVGKI